MEWKNALRSWNAFGAVGVDAVTFLKQASQTPWLIW
jgi:hypothetical protein